MSGHSNKAESIIFNQIYSQNYTTIGFDGGNYETKSQNLHN